MPTYVNRPKVRDEEYFARKRAVEKETTELAQKHAAQLEQQFLNYGAALHLPDTDEIVISKHRQSLNAREDELFMTNLVRGMKMCCQALESVDGTSSRVKELRELVMMDIAAAAELYEQEKERNEVTGDNEKKVMQKDEKRAPPDHLGESTEEATRREVAKADDEKEQQQRIEKNSSSLNEAETSGDANTPTEQPDHLKLSNEEWHRKLHTSITEIKKRICFNVEVLQALLVDLSEGINSFRQHLTSTLPFFQEEDSHHRRSSGSGAGTPSVKNALLLALEWAVEWDGNPTVARLFPKTYYTESFFSSLNPCGAPEIADLAWKLSGEEELRQHQRGGALTLVAAGDSTDALSGYGSPEKSHQRSHTDGSHPDGDETTISVSQTSLSDLSPIPRKERTKLRTSESGSTKAAARQGSRGTRRRPGTAMSGVSSLSSKRQGGGKTAPNKQKRTVEEEDTLLSQIRTSPQSLPIPPLAARRLNRPSLSRGDVRSRKTSELFSSEHSIGATSMAAPPPGASGGVRGTTFAERLTLANHLVKQEYRLMVQLYQNKLECVSNGIYLCTLRVGYDQMGPSELPEFQKEEQKKLATSSLRAFTHQYSLAEKRRLGLHFSAQGGSSDQSSSSYIQRYEEKHKIVKEDRYGDQSKSVNLLERRRAKAKTLSFAPISSETTEEQSPSPPSCWEQPLPSHLSSVWAREAEAQNERKQQGGDVVVDEGNLDHRVGELLMCTTFVLGYQYLSRWISWGLQKKRRKAMADTLLWLANKSLMKSRYRLWTEKTRRNQQQLTLVEAGDADEEPANPGASAIDWTAESRTTKSNNRSEDTQQRNAVVVAENNRSLTVIEERNALAEPKNSSSPSRTIAIQTKRKKFRF